MVKIEIIGKCRNLFTIIFTKIIKLLNSNWRGREKEKEEEEKEKGLKPIKFNILFYCIEKIFFKLKIN